MQTETRKLAAIMFTDIVGFSRQMGSDEVRMLRLLEVHNQIIQHAVSEHHGTVIKTIGDGFLVDFPSVVNAVQCAQTIQTQLRAHNADQDSAEQIHVRIGIHSGDVVQRDGDVFGDGVNIAARLQALAAPDTICISDMVHHDVAQKVPLGTVVSLGRPKLKNIAQRFLVYALLPESPTGLRQHFQVQRLKLVRRVGTAGLTWIMAGLALIGGTIVAIWHLSSPTLSPQSSSLVTQEAQPPLPLPDKPSIVVLPFVNMSGDSEQEYFSDGLTEDLTSDLSKLSGLFVIARNSAFTYKGRAVKVEDVSKELGVRYVLEGSVQKADSQVRITAQLVDAVTTHHLWAERYDRPLHDLFALQDEIVQRIIANLRVKVFEAELARVRRIPTDNLTAYDSLLRGMESSRRANYETNKEANEQARQVFDRAIALDPQYAEAYAYLGWSYFYDWFYQWNNDPAQSLERALELGQQAVALDESLPIAHSLLSQVYLWRKQHDQATVEVKRTIALDANAAPGYWNLGNVLVFAGRPEEAIELFEKAMRLDPLNRSLYFSNLGWAYRVAGRYAEALVPLKKALTLASNSQVPHFILAGCYAELGRLEEAQAEAAEIMRLNPHFSLEGTRQRVPYKDPAFLERYFAAQRRAGLK